MRYTGLWQEILEGGKISNTQSKASLTDITNLAFLLLFFRLYYWFFTRNGLYFKIVYKIVSIGWTYAMELIIPNE